MTTRRPLTEQRFDFWSRLCCIAEQVDALGLELDDMANRWFTIDPGIRKLHQCRLDMLKDEPEPNGHPEGWPF
jgi:hypothetical protein